MRHQKRWTTQKIRKRLELIDPLVYRHQYPLAPFRFSKIANPTPHPPPSSEYNYESWEVITPGDYWLGPATNFLLRTTFSFTAGDSEFKNVALFLPLGVAGEFSHPEAMVYVDQNRVAACDRHHQEARLPAQYLDGETHELLLYGWTGSVRQPAANRLQMNQCWLVQIDDVLREFISTARVALGIAENLRDSDPARHNLINALEKAFLILDTRNPIDERFYSSCPAALLELQAGIERSGHPLDINLFAIGHAHLDLAWLWTLDETRRKAGKTFTNMIQMMEEFPDFRFTQSQPQLYEFVRQDYPDLLRDIKDRVNSGQWEPLGGMWVEADCNLSGSESLVRQLLLGRTYYREHFGADSDSPILWLPDVFGYTANLPQLIRQSGLKYFFTIKLGWNQYNRLPYDAFWWEGIDGTKVLTYFSPTKQPWSDMVSTYNADASPGQILSTWTNFQQKELGGPGDPPPLLMSYGYGDGGGGPTREMVENIELLGQFPASPRVQFGTAHDFFDDLDQTVGDQLPTWRGELYLEYHRGTYTTQSRNKRSNRKSEFLLHDAEFAASFASYISDTYRYPHKELEACWKLLCLNQFHDILPGSSIGAVYEDSDQQYSMLKEQVQSLLVQALDEVAGSCEDECIALLVNPVPFTQDRPLLVSDNGPTEVSPKPGWVHAFTNQRVEEGWLIDCGTLHPYSITPVFAGTEKPTSSKTASGDLAVSAEHLENHFLRVELDFRGEIVGVFDKIHGRQVIPEGEIANEFQLFEDRPLAPDAWDIDIFYDDKKWGAEPAHSIEVKENGPLRVAIEIRRRLRESEIVQHISLNRDSRYLCFQTKVDWKERHTLLKVAFPVEVLSPSASYEIQWGYVERPTHENTSWDWARFETCAHKWADLSEGGYGVALINDCKYGHDIHGNVIRLSLLRGTTDPDPKADLGYHEFAYALFPHSGPLDESVLAAAYGFNDPPFLHLVSGKVKSNQDLDPPWAGGSLISSASDNVIVETIKQAEDGEGIIARIYESMRKRGKTKLECLLPLEAVWITDLLEKNVELVEHDGTGFELWFNPFQIITLRLVPASP